MNLIWESYETPDCGHRGCLHSTNWLYDVHAFPLIAYTMWQANHYPHGLDTPSNEARDLGNFASAEEAKQACETHASEVRA